jgi:carboxyl-terminal processing protease
VENDFEVSKKLAKPKRYLIVGLAVSAVFFFGWAVGRGNLRLQTATNSKTNFNNKLSYDEVEEVYSKLLDNFDGELDKTKILDGLKDGLARAAGDEYTEYLNAEEAEEFNQDLSGTFEGIGAELGQESPYVVIIAPLAGLPADKAGLRPKDKILQINDESAIDISISDAVKKIRGPKDTEVKLTILRGDNQRLEFTIKRQTISIPSVTSEVIDGNNGKIGVLKVSRFGDDTVELAQKAAEDFTKAGVKGVILDLRGDPGGLLDASVKLSELWLDNGKTILVEKRGEEVVKTFTSSKNSPVLGGVKTVVLINEGSASASEIVAGALSDNKAATLIGKTSYGKGSVQQLIDLSGGGVLKVTIARWYTPSGKNIDKDGIKPDIEVSITEEDLKSNSDPQLDAAKQKVGD